MRGIPSNNEFEPTLRALMSKRQNIYALYRNEVRYISLASQ